MGGYWDERTLLRISYAAEQETPRRLPQRFFDIEWAVDRRPKRFIERVLE